MLRRITIASLLAFGTAPVYAMTYTVDPGYTVGIARWSHLGFASLSTQFKQVEGTVEFDQADPGRSSVTVTIPLTAMSAGLPDLDECLRSTYLLNIARFPTATFKSTRVETVGASDQLKVTGNFSLLGSTKLVTLDVRVNKIGTNPATQLPTVGFEATTILKRSDFGLGFYSSQISDEIHIQISAEAAEAKGFAQYLRTKAADAAKEKKRSASPNFFLI
jgi:polyisoprenoid-binding protein YceI